jgi:hypothetical protein
MVKHSPALSTGSAKAGDRIRSGSGADLGEGQPRGADGHRAAMRVLDQRSPIGLKSIEPKLQLMAKTKDWRSPFEKARRRRSSEPLARHMVFRKP